MIVVITVCYKCNVSPSGFGTSLSFSLLHHAFVFIIKFISRVWNRFFPSGRLWSMSVN